MSLYRFESVRRAYPNVVSLDGEDVAFDEDGNIVELDESVIADVYDAVAYEEGFERLRYKRDNKLSESDWMANSDVTMSDAWRTYRQALRDLPANTSDPANPVWPTKPS